MTKKEEENKTCTADIPADKDENTGAFMQELAGMKAELDALKATIADMKQVPTASANAEPAPDPLKEIDAEAPSNELRTIAELTAENNALKAEIEALKKELEDQKATADRTAAELNTMLADAKFSRMLDKIPVGAKATEAQVNAMRIAFDAGDIETILNSVLAPAVKAGATAKEGVPFTQSTSLDKPTGVGDLSKPRKGERA